MDEGRADTGAARQGGMAGWAAPSALQLLIAPCTVAVAGGGLVQDVGHAGESRGGSALCWAGCRGLRGPAWNCTLAVVPGSAGKGGTSRHTQAPGG